MQAELSEALPGPQKTVRTAEKYVNPARAQSLLKNLDCAVIFFSLGYLFYVALGFLSPDAQLIAAIFLSAEVTYLCMISLKWAHSYDLDFLTNVGHGASAAIGLIIFVGASSLLFANSFLFHIDPGYSLLWMLSISAYFLVSRLGVALWARPLQACGAFRQRIAIVGGGDHAEKVIDALETSDDIDVEIVGMFDNRDDTRSPPVIRGYRKLGRFEDLDKYCAEGKIDLIVVTIPMTAHSRLMGLLPKLWKLPVDVRICGQAIDMKLSPRAYTFLGRLPLLTVFSRPLSQKGKGLKRLTDILVSAAILAVTSPVFLAVALAIKLTSRGPVFVKVPRFDFSGNPLGIWRFRTRYDSPVGDGAAEMTPVGLLLRKLGLNEMPEMFNVLTGELSIVGPVARRFSVDGDVGLYEKSADGYCIRHRVKPGLIGWAQIHGFGRKLKSPELVENRVKYDLEYVDRHSLLFDLKIIAKAPFAWLRSKSPQYVV